jgi:hypothetical protein
MKTNHNKKNFYLSIQNDKEEEEKYELRAFPEDPQVNQLFTFRQQNNDLKGFSLYKIGEIHEKLIVQRELTSSEKDRMKDRHAVAVQEFRARTSKQIDTLEAPSRGNKRQRISITNISSGNKKVSCISNKQDSPIIKQQV